MAWAAEIARFFKFNGARRKHVSLPFKDLFVRFHQVLEENTKAMEIITEMEDKLGGEYVFDRKFLGDTSQCLSLQRDHQKQIFGNLRSHRISDSAIAAGVKRPACIFTQTKYRCPDPNQ